MSNRGSNQTVAQKCSVNFQNCENKGQRERFRVLPVNTRFWASIHPLTSVCVEFYSNFFGHTLPTRPGSPVVDYYALLAGKNVRPQSRGASHARKAFPVAWP